MEPQERQQERDEVMRRLESTMGDPDSESVDTPATTQRPNQPSAADVLGGLGSTATTEGADELLPPDRS